MTLLRQASRRLGEVIELDPKGKRLKSKWAHFYRFDLTVRAINDTVRTLERGVPAEAHKSFPGYIPVAQAQAVAALG